jgi:hypothetical protein
MTTFSHINDVTGFANGDRFESAEQVRKYFTVKNLHAMVGREQFLTDNGEDLTPSQATLDAWADMVIDHQWHCQFSE